MSQSFTFRINGKTYPVVSGELITTVDTGCDAFVVTMPVNLTEQRNLYNAIRPRTFADIKIFLNGETFLTGKKTKVEGSFSNSGRIYAIHGFSNTFNFVDSALKPPYEFNNLSFENLAVAVAAQTGLKVVNDNPKTDPITRETIESGQTGFEFLVPIAKKRNRVISSDPKGNVLILKPAAKSKSVGVIEEGNQADLVSQEFLCSFDDRKAFRTYKVTGQSPFGRSLALATDESVPEPRHKLANLDNISKDSIQKAAEWQKHLQLTEDFKLDIPVVGWIAPNNDLWRVNTIVTFKSQTCFMPDGFDLYIRGVRYLYSESGLTAVLSVVPPNIYTEEPIIYPWKEASASDKADNFLSEFVEAVL